MIVDLSKQSTNEYKIESNINSSVPIAPETRHVV